MTTAELRAKFSDCLRFGVQATPDHVAKLAATIARLEELDDVGAAVIEAFPPN